MEKNKVKQVINDIKFWVNELKNKEGVLLDDELTTDDFIFVMENKIESLEKLLEKEKI